jgi:hypothetical protein
MRSTPLILGVLVAIASVGSSAFASEEEFLPWRSLRLDCGDHPQTGKVSLSATAGTSGITAFEFTAFGKAHKLAAGDLAKLRNFGLAGLRVTHEAGYPELGGHTVYFKLSRVYYSAGEKRTIEEVVVVSANKWRGLGVSEPQERRQ